jgi:hypothetical protein
MAPAMYIGLGRIVYTHLRADVGEEETMKKAGVVILLRWCKELESLIAKEQGGLHNHDLAVGSDRGVC